MKKVLTFVLTAAMLLTLFTACAQQTDREENSVGAGSGQTENGGTGQDVPENPGDTPEDGAASVDLAAFFDQLEQDMELGSLMDMDSDVLASFYPGLEEYEFVQYVGKTPAITSVVSEYVLVECQSEDDAQKVVEILQARVDSQAQGGAWYPESMENWGKAKVLQKGNFAALIAAGDSTQEIADKLEALLAE